MQYASSQPSVVAAAISRRSLLGTFRAAWPSRTVLGMVLGPVVGLLVWCLPLGVAPMAHKALAITAFVVVYWMTEALDYGITALFGCYLFWALGVVKFSVAFSGFASTTP